MDQYADVHVALPQALVGPLDTLARSRGVRRAQLVREAVAQYLDRAEAERIDREMREYVEAHAPYSDEFVKELEVHTVERLLRETEW